jgi:hypothetical protein
MYLQIDVRFPLVLGEITVKVGKCCLSKGSPVITPYTLVAYY